MTGKSNQDGDLSPQLGGQSQANAPELSGARRLDWSKMTPGEQRAWEAVTACARNSYNLNGIGSAWGNSDGRWAWDGEYWILVERYEHR